MPPLSTRQQNTRKNCDPFPWLLHKIAAFQSTYIVERHNNGVKVEEITSFRLMSWRKIENCILETIVFIRLVSPNWCYDLNRSRLRGIFKRRIWHGCIEISNDFQLTLPFGLLFLNTLKVTSNNKGIGIKYLKIENDNQRYVWYRLW